jgi:DGQHR domain-containing protein
MQSMVKTGNIMNEETIMHQVKGIPVYQNQQDFLVGIFTIEQILKFTRYTKRLIVSYDENNEPLYNDEIQRDLENPRVEKIADFLINDPDATFPTNIVLHIPESVIEEQFVQGEFTIVQLKTKVFEEMNKKDGHIFISIIDGQHRLKGIEIAIKRLNSILEDLMKTLRGTSNLKIENDYKFYKQRLDDLKNIQIVVSFFVNKTLEYQAMIFSTINRTQKRVSQSLVYSLFGLDTQVDTPQKTALQVVLVLNGHIKSPFYKRIYLFGGTYSKNESPPLSQATMVKSILNLISENLRESELDRFRDRSDLKNRSVSSKRFLPFRKYYAADNDSRISDIIFYFFNAVREVYIYSKDGESYWDMPNKNMHPTNILQTTVGYEALLDILTDVLEKSRDSEYSVEFFKNIILPISKIEVQNTVKYTFNNRGKKIFYLEMSLSIWPEDKSDEKDSRQKELLQLIKIEK